MKKFTRFLAAFATIISISLAPAAVHAQVEEVITEPDPTTTTLPETGGVPDSGIAPSSKTAQTAMVFVGGSALGAAVGLGVVTLRKKKFEQ